MALAGKVPKVFRRTWKRNGVPYVCYLLVLAFSCLAYLGVSAGSAKILNYLLSIITGGGLIGYAVMSWTYIRFHKACKAQGVDRKTFPYCGWFQPYGAWTGLTVELLMILFIGYTSFGPWDPIGFITYYGMLMIALVTFLGWKIWNRTKLVPSEEVDLVWVKPDVDRYEAELVLKPKSFWREIIDDLCPFRRQRREGNLGPEVRPEEMQERDGQSA